MQNIRWGILGPGSIAQNFALHLARVPGATLEAVASRDIQRAQKLAGMYGARALPSYDALVRDEKVDAIYIATPHPMHCEQAIACLRAGKAVLCEKPMAVNLRQAYEMIEAAYQHKAYLMEAMWSRFLPAMQQAKQWINVGAIGKPRYLTADFSYASAFNPNSRLFAPELAGGALLDVGVYPISIAMFLLGQADQASGVCQKAPTGVDEQAVMTIGFEGGALAALHCGVTLTTPDDLIVYGDKGHIVLPHFWRADQAVLYAEGAQPQIANYPINGKDFSYEINAVCEDLRQGHKQNAVMPHEDTLSVLRVTDALRKNWGLRYPFE